MLLNKGFEVVACDINTNYIDTRAKVVQYSPFDCTDSDDAFTLLDSPDICLHLAWRDGFVHNSPKQMKDLSSHYAFLTNLIDNGLKHLAVMGTMHEVSII